MITGLLPEWWSIDVINFGFIAVGAIALLSNIWFLLLRR